MASPHIANIIKANYPAADLDFGTGNVELRDDGAGVFISKWTLPDPQPTIAALDAQEAAYLASVSAESSARQGRKVAVNAKMGLVAGDIDALAELIEDKNLD